MELAKYNVAKKVWDHLKRLYNHSNFRKWYPLESDIKDLKQNNVTIQEFYSTMIDLWDQLTLMELVELKIVKVYIDQREKQCLVQFLMVLWNDFESLHGSIIHHNPLSNVDSIVNELLAEEIKFKTHSNMIQNKGILYTPLSVFVAHIHKGKYQGRIGLGIDECVFNNKKSH